MLQVRNRRTWQVAWSKIIKNRRTLFMVIPLSFCTICTRFFMITVFNTYIICQYSKGSISHASYKSANQENFFIHSFGKAVFCQSSQLKLEMLENKIMCLNRANKPLNIKSVCMYVHQGVQGCGVSRKTLYTMKVYINE